MLSQERQSAYKYWNISYNQTTFNVTIPRHFSFFIPRNKNVFLCDWFFFYSLSNVSERRQKKLIFKIFKDILKKLRSRSCKKGILKNFPKFLRNYPSWSLFLIKLQACSTDGKRGSSTGVLLWILGNFSENVFYRIPQSDCFQKITGLNKALIN